MYLTTKNDNGKIEEETEKRVYMIISAKF